MMCVSQNDSSSRVNVFFRSLVTRALRCVESHEHRVSATAADLSRLSNGCSLYVWCLVCPRSHSALPLCLHFHRPFAHIRSSFRPTSWIPLPLSACPLHFSVSPFSSVLPRTHHPRPHLSSFFPCLLPLISSLYVLSFFYCSAPPSIPYFSFFMSSFPRYHSGAGGSSPLSPRFSSLVSSIDI